MRIDFETARSTDAETLHAAFASVAERFAMTYELWAARAPYRTLIMVSKQLHCLNDLLFRTSDRRPADRGAPGRLQPPRRRAAGEVLRPRVRARAGHPRHQGGGRGRLMRARRGARHRPGRAGALHADPLRRPVPAAERAGHQHPPLVPAELQGRQALPPGVRARGEADRGHGPLRHRRPRRGPDHRAGRHPGRPHASPATSWWRPARDVEAQVLSRAVRWHAADRGCCSTATGRWSSA